jgi:hypothetical protein
MTVEKVWAEIKATCDRIDHLINGLPPDQKALLVEPLLHLHAQRVSMWWATVMQGMTPEQFDELMFMHHVSVGVNATRDMFHSIRDMTAKREAAVKDHFTPKPRMTERNAEVVRLRDVEKRSWKEVHQRIRANPEWAKDQAGNDISARALKEAYGRLKRAGK